MNIQLVYQDNSDLIMIQDADLILIKPKTKKVNFK